MFGSIRCFSSPGTSGGSSNDPCRRHCCRRMGCTKSAYIAAWGTRCALIAGRQRAAGSLTSTLEHAKFLNAYLFTNEKVCIQLDTL